MLKSDLQPGTWVKASVNHPQRQMFLSLAVPCGWTGVVTLALAQTALIFIHVTFYPWKWKALFLHPFQALPPPSFCSPYFLFPLLCFYYNRETEKDKAGLSKEGVAFNFMDKPMVKSNCKHFNCLFACSETKHSRWTGCDCESTAVWNWVVSGAHYLCGSASWTH